MTSSSCPDCGQSTYEATAHICGAQPSPSEAATQPESSEQPNAPTTDAPAIPTPVPPAAPYLPSLSSQTGDTAATEAVGGVPDDAPAGGVPPMPALAPEDWQAYPPGVSEPRYIRNVLWLNVLWGFLISVGVAVPTFGIGLLLVLIVAPIVFGILIGRARDARKRSQAMGMMLGMLLVPVMLLGWCLGLLTLRG